MAERRPLVQIAGRLKELPVGDTLPGASAGAIELLVANGTSAPPVMLTNEAEDDFLYSD